MLIHKSYNWGGIIGTKVIGSYFFDTHLTGTVYLQYLNTTLPVLLEDVPLNIRRDMWVQQDGAPAHFTAQVREYLDNSYPNKWIGRGGPVLWPARSYDLIKMDFFLWGYIKELCFKSPLTTREDMCARIANAFTTITVQVLENAAIISQTYS